MILTVLMSMVGTRVMAYDYDVEKDGIYYNLNHTEMTAEVTYRDGVQLNSYSGDVIIPPTIKNGPYTYNVTSIGFWAFRRSSGLTSVVIPNSVTTIGNYAFSNCSNLTSVTMGRGVTSIDEWAFQNCNSLTKVIISDIAAWCAISFKSVFSNPLFYAKHLYCDAETIITDLNIPDGVTTIGKYAFYNCSDLTSVTIANSVIEIRNSAFDGCSSLTSITIPSSVTSIGESVFWDCSSLTSVTFDQCVPTTFGTYVFNNTNLKDLYYPAYACDYFTTNRSLMSSPTLHPQIKIDREWTTYCATASFEVPEGIDAYVVKSYSDGVVTLKKVTTINEGQGLLLKPASVGTFYDATLCASTPGAYETNLLRGVTSATDITATDGEYTNFIFTKVDDEIGFYPAKAGTIPAYKAYLQIPTASLPVGAPARLSVVFEDGETTSITPVRNNQKTSDEWYTLSGQRSTKPTERGIYIHEGKKVIIK